MLVRVAPSMAQDEQREQAAGITSIETATNAASWGWPSLGTRRRGWGA